MSLAGPKWEAVAVGAFERGRPRTYAHLGAVNESIALQASPAGIQRLRALYAKCLSSRDLLLQLPGFPGGREAVRGGSRPNCAYAAKNSD